jgi:hypothetical protein
MMWAVEWDDLGHVFSRGELFLIEFKGGLMSCAAALMYHDRIEDVRPAFTHAMVVHAKKGGGFCEH